MKESELMRQIQLEASKLGARLLRNNVGMLKDRRGTYVRYGLGSGSSDLIGWYKGRFLAVEVKIDNEEPTEEQENFLDQVNLAGGIGFMARSVEEFIDNLKRAA